MLHRLPILFKIVVLHGLLVAGTMGKIVRVLEARMELRRLLIILPMPKAPWLHLSHTTLHAVLISLLYYSALTEEAGSSRRS